MFIEAWNLPLVEACRATWPNAHWPHWHKYADQNSIKYATKDPDRLNPAAKMLIQRMADLPVEAGWFPDLDLHGAGMHWIPEGGHLERHLDGQVHPLNGWYRKANAILFLDHCEGGELCVEGLEPIHPQPGKLVMFAADQWHEVRKVVSGNRRSLSLFWWSLKGEGVREGALFAPTRSQHTD